MKWIEKIEIGPENPVCLSRGAQETPVVWLLMLMFHGGSYRARAWPLELWSDDEMSILMI